MAEIEATHACAETIPSNGTRKPEPKKLTEIELARLGEAYWRLKAAQALAEKRIAQSEAAQDRAAYASKIVEVEREKHDSFLRSIGVDPSMPYEISEEGIVTYVERKAVKV